MVAHSKEALVWYDHDVGRKCDPGEEARGVSRIDTICVQPRIPDYKHARITTTMSMSTAGRWVVPISGRRMALYSLCLDPE